MSNRLQCDSEVFERTKYQFDFISYAIDFLKYNNNNNDETVSTDWHDTIPQDVRNHFIDKLVESMQVPKYEDIKSFEETLFTEAKSKIEYYQHMAHLMYLNLKRNRSNAGSTASDTFLYQSNRLDQQVSIIITKTNLFDENAKCKILMII